MPKAQFLLDLVPNALMAFSLRKERGAYNSNLITARRSSDNSELGIGLLNDEINQSQLTTFVGVNNGFIARFEDQSLNNLDVIQSTLTNQQQVVVNGAIVTSGGLPAIQGASNRGLRTSGTVTLNTITDMWLFFVVDLNDVTSVQTLLETSSNFNNNNGAFLIFIQSGVIYISQKISPVVFSVKQYPITTGRHIISINFKTGQTAVNASRLWVDATEVTGTVTLNNNSIVLSNQIVYLFARNGNSNGFLGKYQNVLIYPQAVDRIFVESTLNAYYGIY